MAKWIREIKEKKLLTVLRNLENDIKLVRKNKKKNYQRNLQILKNKVNMINNILYIYSHKRTGIKKVPHIIPQTIENIKYNEHLTFVFL